MKLIVGLGNIGPQYEGTRHNTGFMVVDRIANDHQMTFTRGKYESMTATGMINGTKVMLAKPTTYMNESGRAVGPLMDYYDLALDDLLVINDDMDLPVGRIRLRSHGSAGGHNGLKSLIAHLGTDQFNRIKVGVDHPQKVSVVDYVLGKFTKEQQRAFVDAEDSAENAALDWLSEQDFAKLMNQYN